MKALFNSLLRALGGVAVSMAAVALVWTIYINRESLANIAAPLVTPLVNSLSGSRSADGSQAGEEPAEGAAK